jgi:quinoprotein glucose dehydrogenase
MAVTTAATAQDAAPTGGHGVYEPTVAPASPDAARALASFRRAEGVDVELFAAEPMVANIVSFGFDEKGDIYVVETFRLGHGVTDTRGHMSWLDDDLASRTVSDRIAKYRKHLGPSAEEYGREHDRLRLLRDADGDGKPDRASVFADGFHNIPDGLAAGVLARKGDVYFACIPDLWLLKDADGDGKADRKTSLQYGYGVHTGYIGHDLHGLRFGPDGRLYFSIGDRGLNVTARDGRKAVLPDTGAVLRCDPDGSNLELFATGLRNPQELAFDEHGNMFTVDNNSDSGDRARLVYVMEGGDSGWTMGWQYIQRPVSRGPWNAEKMWQPASEDQPAHIVPPLANLSDGPSGLTYDPGVSLLPARYRRHFFLADFRGSGGQSGVRAFSVKPKGAAFELADSEQFLWGLAATDVDFGPDGALYVSDWTEGWNITGKGRIYRAFDPSADAAPAREVKALLAEGLGGRLVAELVKLLSHADQRVRQEAQFALAERGSAAVPSLTDLATSPGPAPAHPEGVRGSRLARLHAIWALGQIGRKAPTSLDPLVPLLGDPDDEVRAQAAKTLGDARSAPAFGPLVRLLKDDSPRVRSLAAIALGKLGRPGAVEPLVQLLRDNADADPFLRHAAVMGLVGSDDPAALLRAASDPAPSVRLGVLLALRRLKRPEVARFLDDADPRLVTEAARAVYDAPVEPAMPALAALARSDRRDLSAPALRRFVNAAARTGDAEALARLAARSDLPGPIRVEATEALAEWPDPPVRDRVTGLYRPRPKRPASEAAQALAPVLADLLRGPARTAAVRAAGVLPVRGAGPLLFDLLTDEGQPNSLRTEALRALERRDDPRLPDAASRAVNDQQPALRVEGRRLLAKLRPAEAIPALASVLETGTVAEQQGAFAVLGTMPPGPADGLLVRWLGRLKSGRVAPEVELDLLEAARLRHSGEVAEALAEIEAARPKSDPLAPYLATLVGGNAARGARIVTEKAEVSCLRCHKVRGRGGEVGPDLSGVARRGDRRYLLESIVAPDRQIAKGFETLLVATSDGQVRSGILKEETDTTLRLITPEGQPLAIPKAEVEGRQRGTSAMPDDLTKHLSRTELRDLVEYLATLK